MHRSIRKSARLFEWRLLTYLVPLAILVVAGCLFKVTDPVAPELTGTVHTLTGEPVENLEVAVPAHGLTVRSGADGKFRLTRLPRGEIDVWIHAANPGSFTLDPVSPGAELEMLIALDEDGSIASLEMRSPTSSGIAEAYYALTRPGTSGEQYGQAVIEGETFSDGEQVLFIEMDHMKPGGTYDVALVGGAGPDQLGSFDVQSDGTAEFEFAAVPVTDGLQSSSLIGKRVELRSRDTAHVQFQGTIPNSSSGRRKGEAELTPTGAAPSGAEGVVKVKSSPGGKGSPDMDELEVRVHDLAANTRYEVCVTCIGLASSVANVTPAKGSSSQGDVGLAASTVVEIGSPNVTGANAFEVPLLITTSSTQSLGAFELSIEYSNACVATIDAVRGAAIPTSGLVAFSTSAQVSGATPGMDHTLKIIGVIANPAECLSPGVQHEVARVRITLPSQGPSSCCLAWNLQTVLGDPETAITDCAGTETAIGTADAVPAPPNCVSFPPPMDCFGTFTTDHKGDGRLRVRQLKGNELPCGASQVQDLEGQALIVQTENTGVVVLEGTVPGVQP